jgi:hypothetical protein
MAEHLLCFYEELPDPPRSLQCLSRQTPAGFHLLADCVGKPLKLA